ncbi:MAG: molecular chaperone DjiA [Hyphomicrobiaceae bacterium]|nr:molecular chaperone DjiA [Hyphomicrobiaceae bacterium]
MTVWQRISGLASVVGDAGGGLLNDLARVFGLDRSVAAEHDIAFTIAVIALSAKMAKADGVVSPLEVQAFRQMFQTAPEEEENVKRVFNLAKQDVAGYESYADEIARLLKDNKKLLQDVLEGLLHIATADGALHPSEDALLADVARRFGFTPSEFSFFRARFVVDTCNPYDVLKLSPHATDNEIRQQYHKLVSDNHPDKLIGRGVPPEFVNIATRKLAAINAAYDTIAKERGL